MTIIRSWVVAISWGQRVFLRLDGIGIGAICDATWYVSPGEQRNQRFLPMSDIVPCTNLA